MSNALFDQVVAATGLSPLVAPFTVRRLLMRSGVLPPDEVTVDQLAAALPAFRDGLAVYLDEAQLADALAHLSRLIERPAA